MGSVGSVSGRTVALLLVLSLLSGTFVPPATAQSSDDPPGVSVSVERRPSDHGVVRYHLDFETPEGAQFWLINYTGNVVSSEGFVTDRTKNGNHALRWDGDTESPSMTITSGVDSGSGREFAATDEWTLAPTPRVSVAWQVDRNGDWEYFHPFQDDYPDRSVSFADAGVLGAAFTYVGRYDEHVRHVDGQTVRMIVAADASPRESPGDVFDALGSASKRLPGKSPDDVLLFTLPDPIWRGGYASPKYDELWVHEDARLDDPQNLWLHEYVHTRQSFELGDRMRWFREASAAYFASALAMQQGRTSKSAVVGTLSSKEYGKSILSKSDTWANREVPYYRGALTLWSLDDRIRRATDGERSLMDVFDRMNRRNESVSYTDFRKIVAEVAGRSLAPWLNKHVTATARLDPSQLQKRNDTGFNVGAAAGGSDGNAEAGHQSGGEGGIHPPAKIGNLPSTLILWGCLGLVGLVFGLTAAQFISGTVSRLRGEE
ncbi:glycyl aminopeptidase [Haladaptatus sp. DYF46]|uniref:glycyl aminopeptidase n=1 Tax=Haladaptatus sp. DYF46 TaxID=2886041 RepID=UPI001E638270|nr:glycyl aminopeptidase [Haladaptatus sp. DYF46]